jgi:hypothetical protein
MTYSDTNPIPRCRKCHRQHRWWYTFANCFYPRALWLHGDGPWASVSRCARYGYDGPTVALHATQEKAEAAVQFINRLACGGRCRGAAGHGVEDLRVINRKWCRR